MSRMQMAPMLLWSNCGGMVNAEHLRAHYVQNTALLCEVQELWESPQVFRNNTSNYIHQMNLSITQIVIQPAQVRRPAGDEGAMMGDEEHQQNRDNASVITAWVLCSKHLAIFTASGMSVTLGWKVANLAAPSFRKFSGIRLPAWFMLDIDRNGDRLSLISTWLWQTCHKNHPQDEASLHAGSE